MTLDQKIHTASNRVRYIQKQGGRACKVSFTPDCIAKVGNMNRIGKKRKTVFCKSVAF